MATSNSPAVPTSRSSYLSSKSLFPPFSQNLIPSLKVIGVLRKKYPSNVFSNFGFCSIISQKIGRGNFLVGESCFLSHKSAKLTISCFNMRNSKISPLENSKKLIESQNKLTTLTKFPTLKNKNKKKHILSTLIPLYLIANALFIYNIEPSYASELMHMSNLMSPDFTPMLDITTNLESLNQIQQALPTSLDTTRTYLSILDTSSLSSNIATISMLPDNGLIEEIIERILLCSAFLISGMVDVLDTITNDSVPIAPRVEEFWENVSRYVTYFFTVATGGLYSLTKPLADLLSKPTTAVLVVVLVGGSFFLTYLVLSSMLGLDGYQYEYLY